MTIKISTDSKPLLFNLIYRSPNSSRENNNNLNEFIKSSKASLTIGDMNYGGIDWHNGCSDISGRDFFNATQDSFL